MLRTVGVFIHHNVSRMIFFNLDKYFVKLGIDAWNCLADDGAELVLIVMNQEYSSNAWDFIEDMQSRSDVEVIRVYVDYVPSMMDGYCISSTDMTTCGSLLSYIEEKLWKDDIDCI